MWSARLDSRGFVARWSDSGGMVACLETIPVRGGSSSDDGGHLALSVAQRKLARHHPPISPGKFLENFSKISLDNHVAIGYNARLMDGAGSTSRLTVPSAWALPSGHDATRPQDVSRGAIQPALSRAAGGAGRDFGDTICPALRPTKCLATKRPRGAQKPKAENMLKKKGQERVFSPAKAENILIIK